MISSPDSSQRIVEQCLEESVSTDLLKCVSINDPIDCVYSVKTEVAADTALVTVNVCSTFLKHSGARLPGLVRSVGSMIRYLMVVNCDERSSRLRSTDPSGGGWRTSLGARVDKNFNFSTFNFY